jgi:hypothetical protein
MDTLGNIIKSNTFHDPGGDFINVKSNHVMTRTFDGAFLMTGNLIFSNNPFLLKVDKYGEKVFYKEYSLFENEETYNHKVLETESNYICVGRTFNSNLDLWTGFSLFVDKEGNDEKVLFYEFENMRCNIGEAKLINQEIFLFGSIGNTGFVNDKEAITKYFEVQLDLFGNELSRVIGDELSLQSYVSLPTNVFLIKNESNFIIAGTETKEINNELFTSPTINSRNQNLEINWKTNLGEFTFFGNRLVNIFQTADNSYFVTGDYLKKDFNGETILRGSLISKVGLNGEEIWTRIDSFPGYLATKQRSYLVKTVELSSGSLMSAGYVEDLAGNNSFGTLYKMDKNGCVNGDCENVVLTVGELRVNEIILGPNPLQDALFIEAPFSFSYMLFDSSGRLIKESNTNQNQFLMDTNDLISGVYYIQLKVGNEIQVRKLVK